MPKNRFLKYALSLLVSLLVVANCGGDDRPGLVTDMSRRPEDPTTRWVKIGVVCESDDDCADYLTCSANGAPRLERGDGQCAASCDIDQECQANYGEYSICSAASVCVRTCDSGCPLGTFCSSDGWCERPGPATTDPYCGGTLLAECDDMSAATCTLLPGCGQTGTCSGSSPGSCGRHSSSARCVQQMGCAWDTEESDCVGHPSPFPCSSAKSSSSCSAASCSWKTEACGGRPSGTCVDVGIESCGQVAGCSLR